MTKSTLRMNLKASALALALASLPLGAGAAGLGKVQSGVLGGDRWFTEKLAQQVQSVPVIMATGSASAANGKVRVNGAQVLGVDTAFWKLSASGKAITLEKTDIALNEPLARKLNAKVGDTVLVRMERPSAISRSG